MSSKNQISKANMHPAYKEQNEAYKYFCSLSYTEIMKWYSLLSVILYNDKVIIAEKQHRILERNMLLIIKIKNKDYARN
jgi:hypothetical protein